MNTFEERLLTELKKVVAEREPAPARTRFAWRLALVPAAVVAVTAMVLVPHDAPAYAVQRQPDDTIRVEITRLDDASGLKRSLERAGIPAVVDYLPPGKTCKKPRFREATGGYPSTMELRSGPVAIFTFHPNEFAGGKALVLQTSGGEGVASLEASIADGPVAPCEPVDAGAGR
ncbi:hypothetical protein [Allorhizocola rhizosphaerae]|uniref:hypothetical protein n=1 Tax=Allorhizocola rhizosphaerae TaxID=1872709 RepID=UPI000E3C3D62|nr:hypothetical protein [Allorhizocola rhizosphaerae]